MSGALYLTEDQPELAEYFEPGTEVLTYTNQRRPAREGALLPGPPGAV